MEFSAGPLCLHSWSVRVVQPFVSPIWEMLGHVATQAARAELQLGFLSYKVDKPFQAGLWPLRMRFHLS